MTYQGRDHLGWQSILREVELAQVVDERGIPCSYPWTFAQVMWSVRVDAISMPQLPMAVRQVDADDMIPVPVPRLFAEVDLIAAVSAHLGVSTAN
jgi:hypothetical protein